MMTLSMLTAQSLICCLLCQTHIPLLVMALSIDEQFQLSDISDNGSHAPLQDVTKQALYFQDWNGLDEFDFSLQEQAHHAPDLNFNARDFGDKQRIPEQALLGSHKRAYRRRQERRPTIGEWQDIRPVFTKLYINEDKSVKEIKAILERDYNFFAR